MLVAEKYAYLEELEPVVEPVQRGPLRSEEPSYKQQTKSETKTAPVPKNGTLNKIVTIGMVLICFATACFAVFRYTLISENHENILELENTLEKEYSRQENLKVELAYSEDLNNIEFTATAELGMQYPEEGQVMYVDLPEPVGQANHAVADTSNQSHNGILARLLGLSN